MANPSYTTGTVSIANGATTLVGTGTVWTSVNARAGDKVYVDGSAIAVEIKDVTDSTHVTFWTPWSQGNKSNVSYIIVQDYPARVVGVAAATDVADLLEAWTQKGPPVVFVEPGGTPDPSLGAEDQYAEEFVTRTVWRKTGGVWVEQPPISGGDVSGKADKAGGNSFTGVNTFTELFSTAPVRGSYWSDVTPFSDNPVFRVRDRLVVDDGCLIPSTFESGGALIANTRAGAALRTAGSNWCQPPYRSSVFALSSVSQIGISAMTTTSMNNDTSFQGSQSSIALLGMCLNDNAVITQPGWALYLEAARVVPGTYATFAAEIEIGNIEDVIPMPVYGGEPAGRTIGIHLYCGGALDEATHVYTPASCAMDIGHNNTRNAGFDRGFVFRDRSISDQGSSVYNAINFPSSYRLSWFRNNSSTDQLQSYITANNNTLGEAAQSLVFGTSNTMTLTAGTVKAAGSLLALSGASGTVATIGLGRTATEAGFAVIASANQVFPGTAAGDFAMEATAANLWIGILPGGTPKPAIKIDTSGLLTLPQYGAGLLQSDAAGIITSSLNFPNNLVVLSGGSGLVATFGIGRTVSEGGLGICGASNQVFTGTVAGDFAIEAGTNLWLGANVASSAKAGIKINTSGLLTFPQYTAGLLQSSATGVVTSSLNVPTGLTALSGASGTVSTFGLGRTASEGGFGVVASAGQVFTGTVAGDFAVEANTNLWLGANVSGTAKAGIKINTSGLLTLPQYGAGFLQTDASGVVTASLTLPTGFTVLSGSTGTVSAFGVGRAASEFGIVVPALANQVFTGTLAGDSVVEASTNLWLAANNSATSIPGIKINTSGLLTFPQYTAGLVQTDASGVVSVAAKTLPSGVLVGTTDTQTLSGKSFTGTNVFTQPGAVAIQILSGAFGSFAALSLGRTAAEGAIGVAGAVDQFATGAIAGDLGIQAQTNLWLAANGSGTVKSGIKIDTSGLLTFSQYGAGLLLTNASGVVSAITFDTDGTLTANSDTRVATQKAVKTYADALIAANDAMVFKGVIDCSTNPNYPAADRGHTYKVSVVGKIGGASGTNVEAGDLLLCLTDSTAGGTQAGVGASWTIAQTNLDGAVIGPASAVSANIASFSGTSGKLIQDSGKALPSGTVVGTTDTQSLSGKSFTGATTFTLAAGAAVAILSGASGSFAASSWGRTAAEGSIGIAASADQLAIGAAAGDFAMQAQTNLWLSANGSGTVKSGIKIDTSGLLTFPQYTTAGILKVSAAGVVSSSLSLTALTGLGIRSTGAAFDLTIASTEALTAGRTLTVTLNDAARTLSMGGNLTTAGAVSLPTIAQGDLWYGSATGVISALAKNASATRYLSNTGTTNNPAWAQIDLTNGVTGVLPSANMTRTPPTRQILKSGTAATYTTPSNPAPIQLRVRMVGGGGGGSGSGTGATGGSGGNGTDTTFSTFTANKGLGAVNTSPGAGGAAAATSGATWGLAGSNGFGAQAGVAGTVLAGGPGGSSPFFYGGVGGAASTPNTGAGGTGGPALGAVNSGTGGGGGAGIEFVINAPAASYTYTVGAAGSGGASGTSGNGGLAGMDGIIIVDEIYQ